MKNADIIKSYVAGDEKARATNLRIEGEKLFNYSTCLAQRHINEDGEVLYLVNATKYSKSSTTIQNMILNTLPHNQIVEVLVDVPQGARSLI